MERRRDTAAPEAELASALHDGDPAQRLAIASLYGALGSTVSARKIARDV